MATNHHTQRKSLPAIQGNVPNQEALTRFPAPAAIVPPWRASSSATISPSRRAIIGRAVPPH